MFVAAVLTPAGQHGGDVYCRRRRSLMPRDGTPKLYVRRPTASQMVSSLARERHLDGSSLGDRSALSSPLGASTKASAAAAPLDRDLVSEYRFEVAVQLYDLLSRESAPTVIDAEAIYPGTNSIPLWYTRDASDCVVLFPADSAGGEPKGPFDCVRLDSSEINAVIAQAGLIISSDSSDLMVRSLSSGALVFELSNVEPPPQSPLRKPTPHISPVIVGYTTGAKLDENWPRVERFGQPDESFSEGGQTSLITAQRPRAGTKLHINASMADAADNEETAIELAAIFVGTKERIDPLWPLLLQHSTISSQSRRPLALVASSVAALRGAEIRLEGYLTMSEAEEAIQILSPTLRRLNVRRQGEASSDNDQDPLGPIVEEYLALVESWAWSTVGRALIITGRRAVSALEEALRHDPANWQAHDAMLWLSLDGNNATFEGRVSAAARALDFGVLPDTRIALPSAFFDPEDLKSKRSAVQELRSRGPTP